MEKLDIELYRALLQVPGFNGWKTIASNADCFERVDPRPQFDQKILMDAFPADWSARSDDELRAYATTGLEGVYSDQFKALTPEIVTSAMRKHIDNLNIVQKLRARRNERGFYAR